MEPTGFYKSMGRTRHESHPLAFVISLGNDHFWGGSVALPHRPPGGLLTHLGGPQTPTLAHRAPRSASANLCTPSLLFPHLHAFPATRAVLLVLTWAMLVPVPQCLLLSPLPGPSVPTPPAPHVHLSLSQSCPGDGLRHHPPTQPLSVHSACFAFLAGSCYTSFSRLSLFMVKLLHEMEPS